jgi:2-C-methyl-D-erythritol 4-phosphate cytidylyltransferase
VTVQTPQAFVAAALRSALGRGADEATDCAGLVEADGGRVRIVPGDERLLKVTTAADLERVAAWLGPVRESNPGL